MPDNKPKIKQDILVRVRWLYVIFILIGVAIFGKVIYLQVGPQSEELKALSTKISYYRDTLMAQRGDILAMDGRVLATVIPKYELRMDFASKGLTDTLFDNNVDALADRLSQFFHDSSKSQNKSKAQYKRQFVDARGDRFKHQYDRFSPRWVDYWELRAIRGFPIFNRRNSGLIAQERDVRVYPHGSLAARTIGFVNQTGAKVGIEGAFDEQLRGVNGSTLMQKISGRVKIPVPDAANVEPVNGFDVVTTLDVDLQDVAEKALRGQLVKERADWGLVVLMEVSTGEIRAMSNLTRHKDGTVREDFNYAIGRAMDPGSTFKLATLIALLDNGGMSLDDKVNTKSGIKINIGGAIVTDDHKNMGVIDLRKVFQISSNVGFAQLAMDKFGAQPKVFTDAISDLGMDKPLGMQIYGEAKPVIWRPGDRFWSGIALQKMAYGYGLNITPMHTLMLYNAVANDGKMVRPLLVKELSRYGQTIVTYPTEVVNKQICSPKTLKLVQECLIGTVDEGTAGILRSPYYKAAGKTGTAWVTESNRGYSDGHYLATLVSYFPAESPKYSCIVVMKTSSGGAYYGSSLSGPVLRAVADRVYASQTQWHKTVSEGVPRAQSPVPLKPGRTNDLMTLSRGLSVGLNVARNVGEWAQLQDTTKKGGNLVTLDTKRGAMPSVIGMGLKEAIYLLESMGLKVSFRGVGAVVSQSTAADEPIVRGQSVLLVLDC